MDDQQIQRIEVTVVTKLLTMRFSCIEPEPNKPDFEHRLYECTTCSSTRSLVTAL